MVNSEGLPRELWELQRFLELHGMKVVSEALDQAAFGNQVVSVRSQRKGAPRFRFVRDRDRWSIDIAPPGGEEWFDAPLWEAMLDQSVPLLDAQPLQEQARFIAERLGEICTKATDQSSAALRELRRLAHQRDIALIGRMQAELGRGQGPVH